MQAHKDPKAVSVILLYWQRQEQRLWSQRTPSFLGLTSFKRTLKSTSSGLPRLSRCSSGSDKGVCCLTGAQGRQGSVSGPALLATARTRTLASENSLTPDFDPAQGLLKSNPSGLPVLGRYNSVLNDGLFSSLQVCDDKAILSGQWNLHVCKVSLTSSCFWLFKE